MKIKIKEFPRRCNGINGVSGALACRFDAQPGRMGKNLALLQLWCICGLDLIPGPETPYPLGQPKKKKKRKSTHVYNSLLYVKNRAPPLECSRTIQWISTRSHFGSLWGSFCCLKDCKVQLRSGRPRLCPGLCLKRKTCLEGNRVLERPTRHLCQFKACLELFGPSAKFCFTYFFFRFRAKFTCSIIWKFPGVELELQLQAYATATETQELSRVCDLHHSSQQRQILHPLTEARD